MLTKKVTATQAKARLSELVAEVAYGGQHIVIERRGKLLAALVSIKELERLENDHAALLQPKGALALLGAWSELGDEELTRLTKDIYARREKDTGRPVKLDA